MNKATIFLMVIILMGSANAVNTQISSLPAVISQSQHSAYTWDTLSFASSRLESQSGIGIKFGGDCHNWVVDLSGPDGIPGNIDDDSLIFGIDSTVDAARAIQMLSGSYDIKVRGGHILHYPKNVADLYWKNGVAYFDYNAPADPDSVVGGGDTLFVPTDEQDYFAQGIQATGDGLILDSIAEVRVIGVEGYAIVMRGRGNLIRGCVAKNHAYAFRSRESFESIVIMTRLQDSDSLSGSGYDYHLRVEDSYIESRSHTGILAHRDNSNTIKPVVQVENCYISIDMRNMKYTDAQGGVGKSTTSGYGILYKFVGPGSTIKNDSIIAGQTYGGGRGIGLYVIECTEEEPLIVTGNYCRCNEGRNNEYPTSYGGDVVKIRQESRGIYMHDNVFVMTLDECEDFTGAPLPYGCQGRVISYEQWILLEAATPPYYVTIENNICSLLTLTGDADNQGAAIRYDLCYAEDTSFHWRNNYVYSEGKYGYTFGTYDGGAAYINIIGDTVEMDSVPGNPSPATFNVGFWTGENIENVARDLTYLGRASDTSVIHIYGEYPPNYGTHEISMQKTLNIQCVGNDGAPMEYVNCTVTNNLGNVILSGSTNACGMLSSPVTYLYFSYESADTLNYNDFSVDVSYSGVNKSSDINVRWDNGYLEFEFESLEGNSSFDDCIDVTPPGRVTDLGMIFGIEE